LSRDPGQFDFSGKRAKYLILLSLADVAELVDARDLKSLDGNVVWVRVPPPAPAFAREASEGCRAEAFRRRRACGRELRLGKPRAREASEGCHAEAFRRRRAAAASYGSASHALAKRVKAAAPKPSGEGGPVAASYG
jgi:hypothetical protein